MLVLHELLWDRVKSQNTHEEKHTCSEEADHGDWNRNSGEGEQDNHLNRPSQTATACCVEKYKSHWTEGSLKSD